MNNGTLASTIAFSNPPTSAVLAGSSSLVLTTAAFTTTCDSSYDPRAPVGPGHP